MTSIELYLEKGKLNVKKRGPESNRYLLNFYLNRQMQVVAVDAFSTLFRFQRPVAETYKEAFLRHALIPKSVSVSAVETSFSEAFRSVNGQHPNYHSASCNNNNKYYPANFMPLQLNDYS
jgi:hypothetical protein